MNSSPYWLDMWMFMSPIKWNKASVSFFGDAVRVVLFILVIYLSNKYFIY